MFEDTRIHDKFKIFRGIEIKLFRRINSERNSARTKIGFAVVTFRATLFGTESFQDVVMGQVGTQSAAIVVLNIKRHRLFKIFLKIIRKRMISFLNTFGVQSTACGE